MSSRRRTRVYRLVSTIVLALAACSIPTAQLVDGSGDSTGSAHDAATDAPVEPAVLNVTPLTDAAFGDVVTGMTSSAASYTVTNNGQGTSTPIAITFADTTLGFALAADTCTNATLMPSKSCTFSVTFSPTAAGAASTTMHVTATSGGDVTRGVGGTGIVPGAINIVETGYDYGNLAVDGTPVKHAFDIVNGGAAMIGAPSPTIAGSTDSYFVDSSTCTTSLMPGQHCSITVRFDPVTVGSKPGSITVTSASGGQDAASLSGVSVATVTVVRAGNGTGSVASTQPGITCGATCVADFSSSPVTLTATADPGSNFIGWSGDCSGSGSCSLDLIGAKTVTATFLAITPTLTVVKTGSGAGTVTSSPLGINCGATCAHDFAFNTMVTLSANPASGSTFTGWGGACSGTGTCSVMMDMARNVTANFDAVTPTLTVTLAGTGTGTVTSPSGINCGATCMQSYPFNTMVTLTATPTAGSAFTGWSGNAGTCTTATTCAVTMDQVRNITATFDALVPKLTVTKTGTGAGTVTAGTGVINCGATCSDTFPYNTMVTLTAAATAGSVFTGWSGACSGSTATCTVTMDADKTATANFAPFTPQLTLVKAGSGTGTVTPAPAGTACGAGCSTYPYNTVVTITAAPNAGSNFTGWSGGGCSGAATTCMVTMAMAQTVTATFDLQTPTLVVTVNGTGTGTVVSTPSGINCATASSPCSNNFTINTVVTLTPTPGSGSTFAGWSGACTGTGACMVTMDAGHAVTATFTAITPMLNVTKAGTGTGTVTSSPAGINCGGTCSATFAFNQMVTLTAAATGGSSFVGWSGTGSGACNGTGTATCVLTMDQARDVTATFTAGLQSLTVTVGGTGTGTVTTSAISCPGTCTGTYAFGTMLTLTAATTGGSTFSGWSGTGAGACAGTSTTTCMVTMDQARAITATFDAGPQTLTVTTSGTGQGTVTSSPVGINCGNGNTSCMLAVPYNTSVSLTATPAGNSTFSGWTGACSGVGACSVAMTAAKSVNAAFAAGPQTITVVTTGTGAASGTVTSAPAGITCGASCSAAFTYGTSVTLTAATTGTATFAGWSGADSGTCNGSNATTCVTTADKARTITATFNAGAQTLTVTYAGTGTGTIVSSPPGLSCSGSPCSASFAYNTAVTLTASATGGSTFSGWSGGLCTGTGTCMVTMDQARAVTATFVAGPQTLTVTKTGTGATGGLVTSAGNVINCGATCNASFPYNTAVTLTATPASGDTFSGWGGACSGSGSCVVTMSAAQSVSAGFAAGPKTLTVGTIPASGGGTVSSTPAGITNCGATSGGTCSTSFAFNTMVTLTAAPAAGYSFVQWGGDCSGTATTCTVTMDNVKNVTATFQIMMFQLSVTPATGGTVKSSDTNINCGPNCTFTYNYGASVTLTETPMPNYHFTGWAGACSGVATTCTVSMTAARSVTASFAQDMWTLTVTAPSNGGITSSDGAINCGSMCTKVYVGGLMTTLTAMAAPHYHFTGWTGACAGNPSNMCILTMDADKTTSATFAIDTFKLSVGATGSGAAVGTIKSDVVGINCTGASGACSANFNYGQVVNLTPTTDTMHFFTGWGGACTGSGACQVTMTADQNVTANFGTYYTFTFNVTDNSPNGLFQTFAGTGGTVAPGSSDIVCSSDGSGAGSTVTCSAVYAEGSVVKVQANWRFLSGGCSTAGVMFTGDCASTTCTIISPNNRCAACQVTMDQDRTGNVSFTSAGTGCL